MRLGAFLAHLSPGPPIEIAQAARRFVAAGFESLWVPQIVGRGFFVADPFVTLAVAASVTEGVEVGTSTVQVSLHHPAALAHRVLSLASVCGGRLSLGVSPGSNAADYAAVGEDFDGRFRRFDERLARLRVLLAAGRDEGADLAPAGSPELPVLLGSWGAKVERAAREFDGWIASAYHSSPDEILAANERYRAAGGGRAVVCAIPVRPGDDLGLLREVLGRYAAAGLDDAVVVIEAGGPDPERVRALLA